jgi:hypothetical protein
MIGPGVAQRFNLSRHQNYGESIKNYRDNLAGRALLKKLAKY